MTPAQELAVFLIIRAACLRTVKDYAGAVECHRRAAQLVPEWPGLRQALVDTQVASLKATRLWNPNDDLLLERFDLDTASAYLDGKLRSPKRY